MRIAGVGGVLVLIVSLVSRADVSGTGPSMRGPFTLRADGSILAGRSVVAFDRASKLIPRVLDLARRSPGGGRVRVTVELAVPAETTRRFLEEFRRGSVLHNDKAAIEGAVLRIQSSAVEFEIRMGADVESVSRASVGLALEELNHRRQAAANHYRALAAEGKQEELRAFLVHYQDLSRVYSQLYQLQRRAKK